MSGRSVMVHDKALESYGFGGEHPFNPFRIRLTLELCESLGLFDGVEFVGAERASEEDLLAVHSLSYVRRVQEAGGARSLGPVKAAELMGYGIGTSDNPIVPGIHEAGCHVVGAMMKASRMVMSGEAEHAMCISGGLHHAMRSRASGFCFYNDAGAAIAGLKRDNPGIRVAYVDTDAHHGDGVQWMFYDDPDVLTISMHESGRYLFPGTGSVRERGKDEGEGYSVNVPLEPLTGDGSWIQSFEEVVPEALKAFGPDIILSQNGCDGHWLDPLTHLAATTRLYEHIPRRVHELAHKLCGGKWVATGGGGYDWWRVVPRAWATLWAVVSHAEMPERPAEDWISRWQLECPVDLPRLMHDLEEDYPHGYGGSSIAARNRQTVRDVVEKVLPLIQPRS